MLYEYTRLGFLAKDDQRKCSIRLLLLKPICTRFARMKYKTDLYVGHMYGS